MPDAKELETRIRDGLDGVTHIALEDLTGTRDHWQATVVATAFQGKTRVQQHQAVYRALGELMEGPVHALALQTYTPEAWQEKSSPSSG
ncbi:MAG TPA: BolA family transcriptional regulator [Polyangiaceae bacterium LLY-WYZ-14_1]|jgi:stress-induced morphogen|nr:BolA family transcriptional regulator [Polyangiaceae bacterium LLY-WYZ-14_1]